jgi:hypothetical protein
MTGQKPGTNRTQYAKNLALAGFAGQVGFLTLAIIIVALLAGLWLDSQFGTRPLFTIGALLASVPITLFIMFRVAMSFVTRIKPSPPPAVSGRRDETDG